jgi:hypothetical protein
MRTFLWALFWIALGVFLLFSNYGMISYHFEWHRDWPMLLIAWGVWKLLMLIAMPRRRVRIATGPNSTNRRSRQDILQAVEKGRMTAEEAAAKLEE